jgi:hypothetical protein
MTIFGFNTDVKQGDVTYHVQSEARQNDLLLQTLIFVKGQCVGKQAFSYAASTLQPGFSEEAMHELLKAQHRTVIEVVQQGQVESLLGTPGEVHDLGGSRLWLKWSNPTQEISSGRLVMQFEVFDAGKPVSSAEISVCACPPADPRVIACTLTDRTGHAALVVPVVDAVERDAAVMARASWSSKSTTRKFRFKR